MDQWQAVSGYEFLISTISILTSENCIVDIKKLKILLVEMQLDFLPELSI